MNLNLKGKTLKNIVNNKYLLYVVAFIAFIDILGFVMREEFTAVLFFYLVGIISYYYTKNMTLVLTTCIIATTLVVIIKNMTGLKEGMKNEKKEGLKNKKKEGLKNEKKESTKKLEEDSGNIPPLPGKEENEKLDSINSDAGDILKELEKKE